MSAERDKQTIENLKKTFENSAYFKGYDEDGELDIKEDLLLSVIIPARNEFPNIVHTVHSILNCWEADGFDPLDIEIIIVSNCCTDYNDPKYESSKPGDRGTVEYLMPRGIYHSRVLRVLYDPIAGNHSARNKGARIARGKYVFFSDAHMSYKPGAFKYGIQACEESGGLVHMAIAWMGAYPIHDSGIGMQYTIKLGEEWKGTWANYKPWGDKWFYIASQGHCSVFANRKQFLDFGGYPEVHRTYGGGEFFIDMLWWLYGSTVAVEPRSVGYHLASSRGYTYTHDDYIHNVFNCSYALGCDDWLERTYLNYLRTGRENVLDRMMSEAKIEMKDRRAEIEQRRICTFNDLLVNKPWDEKNIQRGGSCNSSLLIYHYSWIDLIKGNPKVYKKFLDSPIQKELTEFITTKLHDYIYKWQNYEQTNTKTP